MVGCLIPRMGTSLYIRVPAWYLLCTGCGIHPSLHLLGELGLASYKVGNWQP
jgi:hypothetical protein